MRIDQHLVDLLGFIREESDARGLCSMGGGGTQTTTQKSDPWSGQQPYLQDIYQGVAGAYNSANAGQNMQYYPGQTYAGMSPGQYSTIGQIAGVGNNGGTPAQVAAQNYTASSLDPSYLNDTKGAFTQGQGVLSRELDPGYLNPWNSPSFGTAVSNTLASTIPGIAQSFTSGNRSNSGLAARALSYGATDAVGNLAQAQYQKNQDIQNQAQQQAANQYLTQQGNQSKIASVAPVIDAQTMSDLQASLTAQGMTQQDAQNYINAEMTRYNYGQMQPWNALNMYSNVIYGSGSPGGTAVTSQPMANNTGANVAAGVGTVATLAATAASLY